MRPLIQAPSWDGKIVLGAFFTAGYFAIAVFIIKFGGLSSLQKELAMIVLAALGPQLGQIYGAIFRNTAAEERKEAAQASVLKTAIETPSTFSSDGSSLGDNVEDGARAGARAGVAEGLSGAEAPDPEILT